MLSVIIRGAPGITPCPLIFDRPPLTLYASERDILVRLFILARQWVIVTSDACDATCSLSLFRAPRIPHCSKRPSRRISVGIRWCNVNTETTANRVRRRLFDPVFTLPDTIRVWLLIYEKCSKTAARSSTTVLLICAATACYFCRHHVARMNSPKCHCNSPSSWPNEQNQFGDIILLYACRSDHIRVAELMLETGADPIIANIYDQTPRLWLGNAGDEQVVEYNIERKPF